ncbi:P-loop containing nucleoside triphosphate hydrolase protein [Ephemerocybe angulata]|uniref:Peroxisomal ATPase PEX6 n=1 Tax=Ephemerocybe angulata TaxID=980116 RepID=A0A8H6IH94_9AGAR|nr:P-loop containing nucleoside triphosphate hydrolase protein [Tulosesus angulatus]
MAIQYRLIHPTPCPSYLPPKLPFSARYTEHNGEHDSVLVGSELWARITKDSPIPARICVSVKPLSAPRLPRLPSLISWATLDDSIPASTIAIPREWLQTYQSILARSGDQALITVVEPEPITDAIILATTPAAYELANSDPSLLDAWFNDSRIPPRLPKQFGYPATGPTESQATNGDSEELCFKVDTLEPVLQGYIKKGLTRVVVLLSEEVEHESTPDLESEDSPDNIEIDEISTVNDDIALHLKTADLGKLGLLNSDWGVVSMSNSRSRLVRVFVDDSLVTKSGTAKASPILLHNICARDNNDSDSHAPTEVRLLPSPFGSHRPFIPYQNAFLGGLKAYFEGSTRLVKQGDLIAVTIDADAAKWMQDRGEGESRDTDTSTPINLGGGASSSSSLVFFMITNVEYEVLADNSGTNSQDVFLGSRMGELGCFVDPDVTRIVQAGLEHSRVPDVGAYFETDASSSRSLLDYMTREGSLALSPSSPFGKLSSMVAASLAKFSLDCNLDLSFLVKGNRGVGKFMTVAWVAHRLGIHLLEVNCYDLIGETDTKTEATLRVRFDQAVSCSPCIIVLRKLEALSQSTQGNDGTGKEPALTSVLKECITNLQTSWKMTGFPVILVGIASDPAQVPPSILSQFKHEIALEVPDERTRHGILSTLLRNASLASDVSISELATQTAALVAADLVDLVARSRMLALERVLKGREKSRTYVRLAGFDIMQCDFDNALGKARDLYSESIAPSRTPRTLRRRTQETIGILLYGPPGTGKTLIAKAVATSCSLNFFSVKGPELLNMYIGESEANVRRVFQKARDAKPCVIFFDELDSIAPKRGNHGDSGGVMDRIVSQLLAELDGMAGSDKGSDVFVIGATNRPDLLDAALLRPGRFDRMLYLGVSDTHDAQLNILEALTRKFRLDASLDLRQIAEKCPFNYTGADFYALCSDAMLNAMSRKAMALETKIAELNNGPRDSRHPYPITPQYYLSELATPEEILVTVNYDDFSLALQNLGTECQPGGNGPLRRGPETLHAAQGLIARPVRRNLCEE